MLNLIFQNDHAAFLVVVNRKPIAFFKNDVVTVTRVGGNQIFSPVNHFRPTGEAILPELYRHRAFHAPIDFRSWTFGTLAVLNLRFVESRKL